MLRELKTSDIYKMSSILKKMNLKINASDGKTQQQVGAELILSVFENLHMAENEVNEFLGNLSGMTAEEFSELPIEQTFKIINEFKKMKNITSFFKQASR
jgi:hypothetical protein